MDFPLNTFDYQRVRPRKFQVPRIYSRLKKPEETPHLANIRDEAEKGSSSIIVCEEIRYVFKYVSIIFKKYSRVIIQPEISQNPMGSATGRSPNPPWHRKLLLLQGALWSVRSFQPVPAKVGGSLREIFDCWLFHNSLSLLYHYTPKNPIIPLYPYYDIPPNENLGSVFHLFILGRLLVVSGI